MNNGHGKTKDDVPQRVPNGPHGAQSSPKKLPVTLCVLLFVIGLVSCPQPGSNPEPNPPTLYTVTVMQPEGGTIDANPKSGPAGTVITLSNSPDTEYTFNHYTVDDAVTGNNFTLAKNVTVSGTFTRNGSDPVSQTVTITIPNYNGGSPVFDSTLADGGSASADITITAANKGGIESWGAPVVGIADDFSPANKPSFVITAAGDGAQEVTAAQMTALESIVNQIVSALQAKNVNATSSYSNITIEDQPPQPVSQAVTITIPKANFFLKCENRRA